MFITVGFSIKYMVLELVDRPTNLRFACVDCIF